MEEQKNCMKCTACEYKCPKNAIKLNHNNRIIDKKLCNNCNLCNKVCPLNHDYPINTNINFVAAYVKDDKNRKKSSSGGIFYAIAKKIIEKKGAVYGACFDKDFNVIHKRATTLKDVEQMRGSKYVQSDLKNSFLYIKQDLENDMFVLFSGTPCQVAGLKSYLGKKYDRLLTIDIVCHGTPTADIWEKYIKEQEKKHNSKVKNVEFRSKKISWQNPQMIIEFENNNKISSAIYDNTYGQAFLRNMILQESCYECNFNCFRNQSDITLGDFWGYNLELKKEDVSKGLSVLFLNTINGMSFFNSIRNDLKVFENINMKNAILGNYPIIHPSIPHYNRKNVIEKLKSKSNVSETLDFYLNEYNGLIKNNKNVAILNFSFENYNFGANLLAYALSEIVKRLGYIPYTIDYNIYDQLDSIERFKTFNFVKFRENHLQLTPSFSNSKELSILNDYFDNFIVGSDQVWRKTITRHHLYTYFFDFVKSSKNIIAYAASFGTNSFEGNEFETNRCKLLLNKFNSISVREKEGVDICKNCFDVESTLTIDPTLLLTSEDYCKIIENDEINSPYIALYFIKDHENKFINNPELNRLFPNRNIVNIKGKTKKMPHGEEFVYNSVSEWLKGVKNCDFLITDSYHGVLFAIIFKKQFICLGKESVALSRFNTIFSLLKGNSEKRNYNSLNEIDDINQLSILDYKEIHENLKHLRLQSIQYIEENLKTRKKSNVQYIDLIETENNLLIEEIKKSNDLLEQKTTELNRILNSKSWKYTKLIRKLIKKIRRNNNI